MKTLPFTKEQLKAITSVHSTPFHIYDQAGISRTVRDLQAAFAWNEGFKEYFAVKALPNLAIVQLLRSLGCGADCASSPELMLSEAAGMFGSDIMFSSNDTPLCEFAHATSLDAIINLDDIRHIELLDQLPGFPKTVCCRYNPGGDFSMTNNIMGHLYDTKFGMTRAQILEAMTTLKSKGVERFGIHAMVASATLDGTYYPQLAENMFTLALEIREKTGVEISFLNLSGGIGIPYRPEEQAIDIHAVGAAVREVYERMISPSGLSISIFTELGRYITGPHGYLVSRVQHIKETYKTYVGLDACAANLMRPAMYGSYHHITIPGKENIEATMLCDVTGSLCENNDKFAVDRKLPPVAEGDLIIIYDTGAHGHSMGYNYNGKLRSAELMLMEDGSVRLIRRAETPMDLFATFDCLDDFDHLQEITYRV